MSKIVRVSKETVSLEKLKEFLPESAYQAVCDSLLDSSTNKVYDDSLYRQYFSATPTPVLSEAEQSELFEQLGNGWVKNHFSTDTLRSFLHSEPTNKRIRNKHD
jgi:hypothetical protein